jgi:hypothetical protein
MKQPAPALGEFAEQVFIQVQADAYGGEVNALIIESQGIPGDFRRLGLAPIGDPVGQEDYPIGRVFPVMPASFLIPKHQTLMNIGGAVGDDIPDQLLYVWSIRQIARRQ